MRKSRQLFLQTILFFIVQRHVNASIILVVFRIFFERLIALSGLAKLHLHLVKLILLIVVKSLVKFTRIFDKYSAGSTVVFAGLFAFFRTIKPSRSGAKRTEGIFNIII